jgi:hypothetical protein
VVAARATATTAHLEQELLIAIMVAARKTLDEARAHERTAALAWEKEKAIVYHPNILAPL